MRINERMQDHEEVLVALERSLISRMRKLCGIYRAATERGNILLRIMDDGRELTRKYVNRRLDVLHKLLKTSDDSIAAICRKCGFGSENHPKKLLRQRYSITMSVIRGTAGRPS